MRTAKRLLGVLAVLTWIAVPVVVAGVLTSRSERTVRAEPPASVWVAAGPVETEVSRTIVAQAERSEPPPLLAPAWSGLVAEVGTRAGQPLRSGDTVAVIDGITRLAAATERPLGRPLAPGDQGRDVADLNGWLDSLGYEASPDDRFGAATRRGVLALRRDLGVPLEVVEDEGGVPAEGGEEGVPGEGGEGGATVAADQFDPAWLVFLDQPEVFVESTVLQVGAPAPPGGSTIAELAPQVLSVSLALADQAGPVPAPADVPAPLDDGVATSPAEPAPSAPSDGAPPGPTAPTGAPLTAVAEGAILRVAGQDLGPVGTDASLAPETEAAVIWLLGDGSTTSLQLVEPAPAGARSLAANALFTGPTGAMCVASRTSPQTPAAVHVVTTVGGTATQPLVVGAPDGDLEIQVNPPLAVRQQCRI